MNVPLCQASASVPGIHEQEAELFCVLPDGHAGSLHLDRLAEIWWVADSEETSP